MWAHFEGRARDRLASVAYLNSLTWTDWKPLGITLHNTAAPTLKQWAETGPDHDARIRNLQSYYENDLGWHAGPHWFISRNWINWFSNPLLPGVHSRCFNATRFGIEMVGDYNAESFATGDGALVRDNAIFWIAALNHKFGFDPNDLTFHVECKRDNHDCPGKNVVKGDVIAAVIAEMGRQTGNPTPPPLVPRRAPTFRVRGRMSWFGGPADKGVKEDEGLALYSSEAEMQQHLPGWLLSPAEAKAHGLARRIDPKRFYCAARWPTNRYSFLRDATVWVRNVGNGKELAARAVDWGPNINTGRVADLSPGLALALDLDTDQICELTVYEDGK